jgi:hypothetical protein
MFIGERFLVNLNFMGAIEKVHDIVQAYEFECRIAEANRCRGLLTLPSKLTIQAKRIDLVTTLQSPGPNTSVFVTSGREYSTETKLFN